MKKDISNIEDVKLLVNDFYDRVRKDDLLKDIFNNIIQDRWPIHLEKMYTFWETVLLDNHTYYGSPFAPHAKLQVSKEHFDRWKSLFFATIEENFSGKKADEAKWRAEKMAEMFLYKIEYLRS
ncbi:group III truncated hemoglobin [Joostella atrarenae]|uniref:Group III truncated hemoglobin n=1 Tax=Joostella atrarenae TaxID=679257 RepID=A0ABS9J3C7_9FLAO|nr:group III truncated hemoglobin [Joostella atrarenae]MCF8714931.1 group III truncated hemoglobin [Joostella atrarenae]